MDNTDNKTTNVAPIAQLILTNWLAQFEPYCTSTMDVDETDLVYMTSSDIADELSDMVTLSVDAVAVIMMKGGYWLTTSPDHRVCWVLARRQV